MARVRTLTLLERKRAGEKITALTAYDYPTARLLDETGLDVILVGDSLGTAVQGRSDTLSVTMDNMVYHTAMVSRGVSRAMVVTDMPFLSYQTSVAGAVRNAGRLVAEGGAQAVKLEGSAVKWSGAMRAILDTGIPVMGHIGLTPQSLHQLGGYRVQGRAAEDRIRLKDEALGLEDAGCFAIVLELVAADVAAEISESLTIPTIGIGSGAGCDGQILVVHDVLGLGLQTKFNKVFGDVKSVMQQAFTDYVAEVKDGRFPGAEHEHK
jgi:3-methyl-2-oxobutanoate hydroxymethyltransferase